MTDGPWETLRCGAVGASANQPRSDAMLVWADASDFVDFVREGETRPRALPVLVQVRRAGDIARLADELAALDGGDVPRVYLSTGAVSATFCTAIFTERYCADVLRGQAGEMIDRFELQMAVIPGRPRPVKRVAPTPEPCERGATAARQQAGEHVVGIIDSACAFAHRSVRSHRGGGTRVLAVWDQDPEPAFVAGGGRLPADFGYGCHAGREALDALVSGATQGGSVDEAVCYERAGAIALRARFVHGAAVMDLFTGRQTLGARSAKDVVRPPTWQEANDPASRADVVVVAGTRDAQQDSSSASLGRGVLDGLRYILSCASEQTKRVVVNISDASSRGTHDGESMLEQAMQEIAGPAASADSSPAVTIVLPAGNANDEARHARIDRLLPKELRTLKLSVPPASEAPAWICVRIPDGIDDLAIALVPPGRPIADRSRVEAGQAKGWRIGAHGGYGAAVVVPVGDAGRATMALIRLAPTCGSGRAGIAPHGIWTVTVESSAGCDRAIDLYVCRNETNPGALQRGRQAQFIERYDAYDPKRWLRHHETDAPSHESPIRRRGTLSGIASGPAGGGVVVVGAGLMRERRASAISASGPAAGGGPVRSGPDAAAYTGMHSALRGINAAGALSGQCVRVIGTSFTAPQVARVILNEGALPAVPDEVDTVAGNAERTGIGFFFR